MGMMLPFQGSSTRESADAIRNAAMQAAMDMGQVINLVSFDTDCNGTKAAEAVHQMSDMGVKVVFGEFCSSATVEAVEAAEEADILLVSPTSSLPALTGISDMFFRTASSDLEQGEILADMIKDAGLQNVAIAYTNDTYGEGIAQAVYSNLEGSVENLTMHVVSEGGDVDPAPDAETIKRLDGMVLLGNGVDNLVDLLNNINRNGFNGTVMGGDTLATTYFIGRTGVASEGMIVTAPVYGTDEFVDGYTDTWGTEPITYSSQGYDAMKAIITTWRLTDRTTPTERTSGPLMAKNMLKVAFEGAQGEMAFGKDGNPLEAHYDIYRVESGGFVIYEQINMKD